MRCTDTAKSTERFWLQFAGVPMRSYQRSSSIAFPNEILNGTGYIVERGILCSPCLWIRLQKVERGRSTNLCTLVRHYSRAQDKNCHVAEREAEMAQEWFRRAGVSRPISLELHCRDSSSADFIGVILPAILPTSNVWQHLRADLAANPGGLSLLKVPFPGYNRSRLTLRYSLANQYVTYLKLILNCFVWT
jgi:hypothetical protein